MNKYFVFDSGIWIGHLAENADLKVNKLKKDTENNPLFTEGDNHGESMPWEVRYDNSYPNIIYDDKYEMYRVYYTLFTKDLSSKNTPIEDRKNKMYDTNTGRRTSVAYAESKDGIHWNKPKLNKVEINGSTENNILMKYAHGTGVFLDSNEPNPEKRYKLVTKVDPSHNSNHMGVAFSENGIDFTDIIPWPKYNPPADAHNFPFYDKYTNEYKLITRTWANGLRIVALSSSPDFINWSEPIEVARGEGIYHQIYSMPVYPLNDIYLGFASMYHEGDRQAENFDTVDLELMFSTDLLHWERIARNDYFIERGKGTYGIDAEFDAYCIFSGIPLEIDDKIWVYYMGGNGQHTNFRETSFARGYIEKDQFAYYTNLRDQAPAKLFTRQFTFTEKDLYINADIPEGGYIKVNLVEGKKTLENYGEGQLVKVDKNRYQVKFLEDLEDLRTRQISIQFEIENAKLYTIEGDLSLIKLKY